VSDNLNVNVPEIDDEHRHFVARNQVTSIVEARGQSDDRSGCWISMLMEAVHIYWHEEQLWPNGNIRTGAGHAAKHAKITEQSAGDERVRGRPMSASAGRFKGLHIKQLLVDHLLKEDMKYRDFLRRAERRARLPGWANARTSARRLPPDAMGAADYRQGKIHDKIWLKNSARHPAEVRRERVLVAAGFFEEELQQFGHLPAYSNMSVIDELPRTGRVEPELRRLPAATNWG